MDRIKLIIVDDQRIILDGISSMLQNEPGIEIIGRAINCTDAIRLTKELRPDVVLADISMPNMDRVAETIGSIASFKQVRVLISCMRTHDDLIKELLEAGAMGCILKTAGKDELVEALQIVASGQCYLPAPCRIAAAPGSSVAHKRSIGPNMHLTDAEIKIVRMICSELSNKEIARELYISVQTVGTHRKNLLRKLNVCGTAGLVKYAVARGWRQKI